MTETGETSVSGPPASLRSQKAAMRAAVRAQLGTVPSEVRAKAGRRIQDLIRGQEEWQRATCILFFAPLSDEPDISDLVHLALGEGKRVLLPQFNHRAQSYDACEINVRLDALVRGRFGIPEPGLDCPSVPLNQLDFGLIPGVAFDLSGHRLGRGRGYYDRLLAGVRGIKCGVCFDEQVTAQIPVDAHDAILDCIVTPTRWLDFRPRRPGDDLVG